ncbi:hypothetical protein N7468_002960 [Penicillium chermesinum]|uniref:Myb-like domain-containing protein n=1 Tax=Penicillium chermesinum TaxID=63820 RepID=A0A9W9TR60_9EURO|nr:uncharacterized protein N7468_002960 [Penicillium chermesinum]KAJ5238341.1 hypothetical protein N7468_002960 [Penicillium chermesinum]KAJ6164008.1 hypothetical protein N7470_002680 [Penicillium chermesinum]
MVSKQAKREEPASQTEEGPSRKEAKPKGPTRLKRRKLGRGNNSLRSTTTTRKLALDKAITFSPRKPKTRDETRAGRRKTHTDIYDIPPDTPRRSARTAARHQLSERRPTYRDESADEEESAGNEKISNDDAGSDIAGELGNGTETYNDGSNNQVDTDNEAVSNEEGPGIVDSPDHEEPGVVEEPDGEVEDSYETPLEETSEPNVEPITTTTPAESPREIQSEGISDDDEEAEANESGSARGEVEPFEGMAVELFSGSVEPVDQEPSAEPEPASEDDSADESSLFVREASKALILKRYVADPKPPNTELIEVQKNEFDTPAFGGLSSALKEWLYKATAETPLKNDWEKLCSNILTLKHNPPPRLPRMFFNAIGSIDELEECYQDIESSATLSTNIQTHILKLKTEAFDEIKEILNFNAWQDENILKATLIADNFQRYFVPRLSVLVVISFRVYRSFGAAAYHQFDYILELVSHCLERLKALRNGDYFAGRRPPRTWHLHVPLTRLKRALDNGELEHDGGRQAANQHNVVYAYAAWSPSEDKALVDGLKAYRNDNRFHMIRRFMGDLLPHRTLNDLQTRARLMREAFEIDGLPVPSYLATVHL